MMQTTCIIYCGRKLEVPVFSTGPLHMPYDSWDHWERGYCGAGDGFLEWIVPEELPGGTILTPV